MRIRKRLWVPVALSIFLYLAIPLTCLGLAVNSLLAISLISSRLSGGPVWEDTVAVVRVEGVLVSGREYSESIIDLLHRAENDPAVKAIVLRVDSPGGGVVASDEIYGALLGIEKPIVVSMGDVAASGGYYISCAADKIVANPTTLTGSIGVIATAPNYEELLDKIGIEMLVIKSGPMKDELSPYREPTEEEIKHWQGIIDEAYERFVRIVARARNLSLGETRRLADGRVYTGQQALELGLVDKLGDLPQAIDLAAQLGGIEGEPRVIEYQRAPTLIETLLTSLAEPSLPVNLDEFMGIERRFTVQYLYISP
jgi:protease-4